MKATSQNDHKYNHLKMLSTRSKLSTLGSKIPGTLKHKRAPSAYMLGQITQRGCSRENSETLKSGIGRITVTKIQLTLINYKYTQVNFLGLQ